MSDTPERKRGPSLSDRSHDFSNYGMTKDELKRYRQTSEFEQAEPIVLKVAETDPHRDEGAEHE